MDSTWIVPVSTSASASGRTCAMTTIGVQCVIADARGFSGTLPRSGVGSCIVHLGVLLYHIGLAFAAGCLGAVLRNGGLSHTYGDKPAGQLLALVGSSGYLEIAVAARNAAERLAVSRGAPVRVGRIRSTQRTL